MKTMHITKQSVLLIAFLWWCIFGVLQFAPAEYAPLLTVVGFSFLILVPGFLTLGALRMRFDTLSHTLLFSIGMSVFEIMVLGLLVNTISLNVGILTPLTGPLVGYAGSILLFCIGLIYYERADAINYPVLFPLPIQTLTDVVVALIPSVFVLISTLGAMRLNDGGTGTMTVFMLLGIVLYSIVLLFGKKNANENVLPIALYFISLSLLLMASLRGDFIIGHDIQREFDVFQLTKNHGLWSPALYRDAYNACLSITIFPTVLRELLSLPDQYIFKVLFQLLFALVPSAMYVLIRNVASRSLSYASVLFFVSFPTFFTDMPFIVRQEIAFVFLGLMLLSIFTTRTTGGTEKLLPFVFGLGVIFSHYTTTYTLIALLCITLAGKSCIDWLRKIFAQRTVTSSTYDPIRNSVVLLLTGALFGVRMRNLFEKIRPKNVFKHSGVAELQTVAETIPKRIGATLILVLVVVSFLWGSIVTKTSTGSLARVIENTVTALGTAVWSESKSGDVKYNLFSFADASREELFATYKAKVVDPARARAQPGTFYDESTYAQYPMRIIEPTRTPESILGRGLSSVGINVYTLHYSIKQTFAKLLQVLILFGFIGVLFSMRYLKRPLELEFVLFASANVLMVAAIVLLPILSVEYGVLRAFQQGLIVLGLFIVMGTLTLARGLPDYMAERIVVGLALLFFMSSTGVFTYGVGGYEPSLHLNNSGLYFDTYYVREGEVAGLMWLAKEKERTGDDVQSELQIDPSVFTDMQSITDPNPLNTIYPGLIRKDAYVFLNYINVHNLKSVVVYHDTYITYEYPIEFLDAVKDVVYDNGVVRIYR